MDLTIHQEKYSCKNYTTIFKANELSISNVDKILRIFLTKVKEIMIVETCLKSKQYLITSPNNLVTEIGYSTQNH